MALHPRNVSLGVAAVAVGATQGGVVTGSLGADPRTSGTQKASARGTANTGAAGNTITSASN